MSPRWPAGSITTPRRPRVPKRRLATAAALFPDQTNPRTAAAGKGGDEDEDEEGYREVDRIVSSRTVKSAVFAEDGSATTVTAAEYLVEWKDGHEPTWIPAEAIAADVVAEYETPWWEAAKKADADALGALLADEALRRDPNAEDAQGRTAMHFAAGLGSEECLRALAEAWADVGHAERAGGGLTPLHIVAGYGRATGVQALLELAADKEAPDGKGRTPLELVQEVLAAMPPLGVRAAAGAGGRGEDYRVSGLGNASAGPCALLMAQVGATTDDGLRWEGGRASEGSER